MPDPLGKACAISRGVVSDLGGMESNHGLGDLESESRTSHNSWTGSSYSVWSMENGFRTQPPLIPASGLPQLEHGVEHR
jgi:hypothetical protein